MQSLRLGKRRLALTTAVADVSGHWSLYDVTEALSDFADTSISVAASHVIRKTAERGGFVLKSPNHPEIESGFIVIGMGKLGARELNYSSDVDLICLFDPDRIETDQPDKLQKHAIRMTRTLARILDERTTAGYVFRVDLRLRPDPGSTPLAISTLAAETYYESLGQNWERAAMIKARAIAGDLEAGEKFLSHLRPFVWRKSLDFAAIQDIHAIKRQMHAHKGGGEIAINGHDVKTGRGGIREIEFFAQTQQLIWGGRVPQVRSQRTIEAIRALVELGQVGDNVANDLDASYAFLRNLEHRLQMRNDEQTQKLPAEDSGIESLGNFLGYKTVGSFRAELRSHLETVSDHYSQLFNEAPALTPEDTMEGNLSFTGVESDLETLTTLKAMGFDEPEKVDAAIRAWHHGRIRATRSVRSREILTELTPAMLSSLARQSDPDSTFLRFDTFISALPAGVQLFSLFQSNPAILDLIAEIMGDAPRLATHLGRHPNLLDSVLTADFYDPIGSVDDLVTDCRSYLEDTVFFEDVLDATRRWNHDRRFQVGVQMLRRAIAPSAAAASFSDIAESVLRILIPEVIQTFSDKHGVVADGRFCVLALGKLGSRELTPSSDLDLIFVYDAPDDSEVSDGAKPLSPSLYFTRLGQRIISSVSALTAEGTLYEIDMRLRPSGNKGPVASSSSAFERYYREDAWTWEHLALVRARPVFDTDALGVDIMSTVQTALSQARDLGTLAFDVRNMRKKIAEQHKTECIWSLKHVRGGQVDIDFMAQYLVLAHANTHADLLVQNSDEIFQRAWEHGLIEKLDAESLLEAKNLFRRIQTFLALAIEGELTDQKISQFSPSLKDDLVHLSDSETFDALEKTLLALQRQIVAIFDRTLGP